MYSTVIGLQIIAGFKVTFRTLAKSKSKTAVEYVANISGALSEQAP